jgi:hypothetical protein
MISIVFAPFVWGPEIEKIEKEINKCTTTGDTL